MVIRARCRRVWLASLMRSIRNEIVPLPIRRRLIVVDLPRIALRYLQRGSRGQASTSRRLIGA